jgi:hypothetical protein
MATGLSIPICLLTYSGTTHQLISTPELTPEIVAPVLLRITSDDILNSRISNMTDGEDGCRISRADVLCQTKDWPAIADRAEVGVERVGQFAVV